MGLGRNRGGRDQPEGVNSDAYLCLSPQVTPGFEEKDRNTCHVSLCKPGCNPGCDGLAFPVSSCWECCPSLFLRQSQAVRQGGPCEAHSLLGCSARTKGVLMIHRVLRLQGPQARGPAGNTGVLQNPPESSCHATGCRAAGEGFKTQNFSVEIIPTRSSHVITLFLDVL